MASLTFAAGDPVQERLNVVGGDITYGDLTATSIQLGYIPSDEGGTSLEAAHHWDESTNGLLDYSSNSHTGSVLGAPTRDISGVLGRTAWSFDGVDDKISIDDFYGNNIEATLPLPIVFSFWVKWTHTDTLPFFDLRQQSGTEPAILVYPNENETGTQDLGNIRILTKEDGGTSNSWAVDVSPGLDDGNWHHVVIKFTDITTGVLDIWIDGQLQTVISRNTKNIDSWNQLFDSVTIGGTPGGEVPIDIDEMRIYTRGLTASEITDLYIPGATNFLKFQDKSFAEDVDVSTLQLSTPTQSIPTNTTLEAVVHRTDGSNNIQETSNALDLSGTFPLDVTGISTNGQHFALEIRPNTTDKTVSPTLDSIDLTADLVSAIDITDWSFKKKITIDHTKVDADLTDFPVLIHVDSDADLAAGAQADGDDILFTDDTDTKLDHEIESYDSATGTLWAHVNLPTISSTVDTVLYLYYGNSGAVNQETPDGVWSPPHEAVYHMDEEVAGVGNLDVYKDSTANAQHADDQISSTDQSGQIFDGQLLDGTDDYLDIPTLGALGTGVTVQFWIRPDNLTTTANQRLLSLRSNIELFAEFDGSLDTLRVWAGEYHSVESLGNLTEGQWVRITVAHDGSTLRVYVDGVEKVSNNDTYSTSSVNTNVFGISDVDLVADPFIGAVDEIRIATSARSAGWITTGYNNQSSPLTFYSIGAETNVPDVTITEETVTVEEPAITTTVGAETAQIAAETVSSEQPGINIIEEIILSLSVQGVLTQEPDPVTVLGTVTPSPSVESFIVQEIDGSISREGLQLAAIQRETFFVAEQPETVNTSLQTNQSVEQVQTEEPTATSDPTVTFGDSSETILMDEQALQVQIPDLFGKKISPGGKFDKSVIIADD
jgi:hypothetical protein